MRARRVDRPPTIRDVAREAGVSLPTVSRVLTGSVPVSEHRQRLVREAMQRLQYRPNGAARALVQGRQPIVGIIAPDVRTGSSTMIAAVEDEARRSGYAVSITVIDSEDLSRADTSLDVLLAQPIAGVVVLDFDRYDLRQLEAKLGQLPLASISSEVSERARHVVVDDRRAARALTEHLLELGHPTVHHVSFPGLRGRPHARELGWRDALTAVGAPIPAPVRINARVESERHVDAGRAAVDELLAAATPSAVFCANDQIAFGVTRTLLQRGFDVPRDVSVVGLDDEILAEYWTPALTSYRLDFDWAGRAALQALLSESAHQQLSPAVEGLRVRASSGPYRSLS